MIMPSHILKTSDVFVQRLKAYLWFLECLKVEWVVEPSDIRPLYCRNSSSLDSTDSPSSFKFRLITFLLDKVCSLGYIR